MQDNDFNYIVERFADIQILRYQLNDFDQLTLRQKKLVYYLSEAALCGRDITFDQFGKYNLRLRKLFETIYLLFDGNRESDEFQAIIKYLKRVWFSNGIYHHYASDKLEPEFTQEYLKEIISYLPKEKLPLKAGETISEFCKELFPVIFDKTVLPKRVNKADGVDIITSSACNFYEGVTQKETEAFYEMMKAEHANDTAPISYGLNSKLVKDNGRLREVVWKEDGLYGPAIKEIVKWLEKASSVAENELQGKYINSLITYYQTGNLHIFNKYCIEWVGEHESRIDFVNGFIEVYGDPLGLKGSWESIVEYKDLEATRRTRLISSNAQWFEDHSPIDSHFKKKTVKGVTANVICAAMLGGDEYPSTAIGINLPNADWIREEYGSKSVTIGNLMHAYNQASKGNGFKEEFVIDEETISLIDKYGEMCDVLHTDLHECLGHGSGVVLPGVDMDALKAYGSTIEEARADLFGLYFIADKKLVELGLLPNMEAYKSLYYTYMLNGLMTQLTRIEAGCQIEEAHMRNRALIANWCYKKGSVDNVIDFCQKNEKTYIRINDYHRLREFFSDLLREVQRIKSEGDFDAARALVETYGVKVDGALHLEVLERYKHLDLAPYKGFLNPRLIPVLDEMGEIEDIAIDYSESYEEQMLRYSHDYSFL